MTAIANVSYSTKRLYLHADTVTSGIDISQAYIELIDLFMLNANSEQSYPMPLDVEGNAPKGGGKFTQMYGVLRAGWRIVPYGGVSHTLRILREIVSDDGVSDRNVFDRAPVPPSIVVEIDSDYDKIEIREIVTSGNQYTLGQISSAVHEHVLEAGKTFEQMMRIQYAVLAGKVLGAGTDTERFRDIADTKDRLIVTADEFGNRTGIVADGT
jgi:hypothetical protein